VSLLCFWMLAEVLSIRSCALRAVCIGGLAFQALLFFRGKLYFPLILHCIDWDKVDSLLKENPKQGQ
jgi:hypothetical protein